MFYIERKASYADKLRSYDVEVDGVVVGSIANGENKAFDVTPGPHILRLRLSWTMSNMIKFDTSNGKPPHFVCQSNLHGGRVFLAIVYALFLPHKYIKLKQI